MTKNVKYMIKLYFKNKVKEKVLEIKIKKDAKRKGTQTKIK